MVGDCSTCGHSIGAQCLQGTDGQQFLCSDAPLPCPFWVPRGETWEREWKAFKKRNHWPISSRGN